MKKRKVTRLLVGGDSDGDEVEVYEDQTNATVAGRDGTLNNYSAMIVSVGPVNRSIFVHHDLTLSSILVMLLSNYRPRKKIDACCED